MPTITILVKGKVQGVYYRQSTREKAEQLGITGTVKNLADKSVEIRATGTEEQLKLLEEWCRQGPPGAIVSEVITTTLPPTKYDGFKIERR